jgi:hypothetical protein
MLIILLFLFSPIFNVFVYMFISNRVTNVNYLIYVYHLPEIFPMNTGN